MKPGEAPAEEAKPAPAEEVKAVDLTAGLAQLRDEAARDDAPPAPEVDAEEAAAAGVDQVAAQLAGRVDEPDTAEDWETAIELAVEWFSDKYPALATVYTDRRRKRIAEAIHRVAVKRGFNIASAFMKWKEEVTLLIVAAPVLRDTRKAIERGAAPAPAAVRQDAPARVDGARDDGVIRPTE